MRASQETLLREIARQNDLLLDSMTVQDVRLRGDMANRLLQMERQLVQIQELTGQGQQRLVEMRQELRRQEEAMRSAGSGSAGGAMTGDPADPRHVPIDAKVLDAGTKGIRPGQTSAEVERILGQHVILAAGDLRQDDGEDHQPRPENRRSSHVPSFSRIS